MAIQLAFGAEVKNIEQLASEYGDGNLLDYMPQPVFLIRFDHRRIPCIEKINAAMISVIGVGKAPRPGTSLHNCLPVRWADNLNDMIKKCVYQREPCSFTEVHRGPTGERFWKTTLTPMPNRQGNIVSIVGVAEELTEYKRNEIKQAEKLATIQKRMNELNLFSTVAAHDLRSPMCQLDMLLRLVMKDFEDLGDGKVEMLKTSREVIARGIGYLDDVLQYCGDCASVEPDEQQIDLSILCGELTTFLDPKARHLVSYSDMILHADANVVGILLRNLIDSAIRRNPDQTLLIDINVHDAKGGWLMFCVYDNGSNFLKTGEERPAECKSQSEAGLYGIRQLLAARGGNLRLSRDRNGIGTKVTFSLPGRVKTRLNSSENSVYFRREAA